MRLLIADDEARVRSALRLYIEQDLDGAVVSEAETMDQLWVGVNNFKPDVLFLDWEFPGFPCQQFIQNIRHLIPELKIIAFSGKMEAQKAARDAGVNEFVSKNDPPEKVMQALLRLQGGPVWLKRHIPEDILH